MNKDTYRFLTKVVMIGGLTLMCLGFILAAIGFSYAITSAYYQSLTKHIIMIGGLLMITFFAGSIVDIFYGDEDSQS